MFVKILIILVLVVLHLGSCAGLRGAEENEVKMTTTNQYLLSASNTLSPESTPQATLTITSSHPDSSPLTYIFPNHPLSPACGNHVARCRQLVMIQEEESHLVGILVPLHSAIGLVVFEDIGRDLINLTTHMLPFIHYCQPVTIVEFRGKHYTVCIDSVAAIISCSINHNLVNVSQSYLQCSTTIGRLPPPVGFSFISNFVHVNSDFLVFTVADYVHMYYPERFSIRAISPLPHIERNVRLVFNGHESLLMYYDRNGTATALVYDLSREDWHIFYSSQDLPYTCLNGYQAFVHPNLSVIVYEREEAKEQDIINIVGQHFNTGLCFGDTVHSYLVYIDQFKGTFVLNITSRANQQLVSSAICDNGICQTPVLYQNRYFLLREAKNQVVVRDSQQEYAIVVELDNFKSELVGFHTGKAYENSHTLLHMVDDNIIWIVIVVVVLSVVLSVIVGTPFCVLMWRAWRSREGVKLSKNGQVSIEESTFRPSLEDSSEGTRPTKVKHINNVSISSETESNSNNVTDIKTTPTTTPALPTLPILSSETQLSGTPPESDSILLSMLYPDRGGPPPNPTVQQSTSFADTMATTLTTPPPAHLPNLPIDSPPSNSSILATTPTTPSPVSLRRGLPAGASSDDVSMQPIPATGSHPDLMKPDGCSSVFAGRATSTDINLYTQTPVISYTYLSS